VVDTATIHGTERREDIEIVLGDLSPLRRVYIDLNVPFHLNMHPDRKGPPDELGIPILCESIQHK
jgi:hypothetical protein